MHNLQRAKAHVFGKNIDTDQILPGRYLELTDPEKMASHCLEGADPGFAHRVQQGDLVVAGTNFGCGSSREHAAMALIHAGVAAVLAESFARIFYRNAINLALPLMVCRTITKMVKDGDVLQVDIASGTVYNLTTGQRAQGERVSPYAMHILESGGIIPLFQKKMKNKDG